MAVERRLARQVQRRLQAKGVYVHNMLARLIVRIVLDLLTEMFPAVARNCIEQHRIARIRIRHIFPALRKVYSEAAMRHRMKKIDSPDPTLQVRWVRLLDEDEVAALMLAIEGAKARRDMVALRALNKALQSLRD